MSHEPECYRPEQTIIFPCICEKVRAAYRRGATDGLTQGRREGYESGYRRGLVDAERVVSEYADERLVKTKHPNMSEDITAALRVAAKRVRDAAFRQGYNDHARSRAELESMFGPYLSKTAAERLALWDRPDAVFNQHGKGENP